MYVGNLKAGNSADEIFTELANAQEKERKRIAFDIHDGPAQSISSALLQIGIMEELFDADGLEEEFIELKKILKSILEELQNIINQLYPRSLMPEGLVPKVKCHIEEFKARTNINVNLKVIGEERELTTSAQIAIFRVIQEALTNVHKHADADRVDVELRLKRKEIECFVADNGKGFLIDEAIKFLPEADCFGLMGMYERVGLLGGMLNIVSEPNKGAKIKIKVPIWEQRD
ncbi:MAG TPA: sensor histidine kinase [Actinobacteria bacterium]|nr:sensor histidine kinase [Actinomycetota bacterium]